MYKVILVEDEILVREGIAKNIRWKDLDFNLIATHKNGFEAKEFLTKNKVDLVITDISMPYMDGIELSEYIYINHPETKVIICSGYDDFEYAQKALKFKVEEYMLKPITSAEISSLLVNIRERLNKKKSEEIETHKISKTYFENRSVIKSKILNRLMMGTAELKEIEKEMQELEINIKGEFYRIVAFDIDNYGEIHKLTEEEKRFSELMSFSVANIAEEILKINLAGEIFIGDRDRVYGIVKTEKNNLMDQKIIETCDKVKSQVLKLLKLNITIGIGSKVKTLSELYFSWKDAMFSLDFRYILGSGQTIFIEDIREKYVKSFNLNIYVEEIIEKIRNGELELIGEVLQEIEAYIRSSYIGKYKLSIHIQQLVSEVNRFVITTENLSKENLIIEEVIIETIESFSFLEQIIQYLHNYFVNLAKNFQIQKDNSGKKIAINALNYIDTNYWDQELSLTSVCTYLYISPSHFSKIFKMHTGETFVEALTKKRMEKAKEFLENTALKNYEIASKVGFSDPHYFSITFKKTTGMTPKEYARERR